MALLESAALAGFTKLKLVLDAEAAIKAFDMQEIDDLKEYYLVYKLSESGSAIQVLDKNFKEASSRVNKDFHQKIYDKKITSFLRHKLEREKGLPKGAMIDKKLRDQLSQQKNIDAIKEIMIQKATCTITNGGSDARRHDEEKIAAEEGRIDFAQELRFEEESGDIITIQLSKQFFEDMLADS